MDPETYIARGAELLVGMLDPFGFRFDILHVGQSSGGDFAEGAFTRGGQQIRLWVRHGKLGGVTYRAGASEWSNSDYMRALGLSATAHYPGFDDGDPLGGFRRLLADLDRCDDFLAGDGTSVAQLVRSQPPPLKGFKALGQ